MQRIAEVAILIVLFVGGLAVSTFGPLSFPIYLRDLFRNSPEAKRSFIAGGSWIAFSRRFGLPYVITLLIAPFVWLAIGVRLIPDTTFGAWLLFGPATASIFLGVALGALCVARWIVDEG